MVKKFLVHVLARSVVERLLRLLAGWSLHSLVAILFRLLTRRMPGPHDHGGPKR